MTAVAPPGPRRVVVLTAPEPAPAPVDAPTRARGSRLRSPAVLELVRPATSLVVIGVLVLLPRSLVDDARAALFAFAAAVVLWSMTSLPTAWTALVSVLLLVGLGGAEQDALYDALASDVVWLMIGAFVIGGAVQASGLAARLTRLACGDGTSVGRVMWRVTFVLLPLSVLIPSTSGRAAVMMPVYRSLVAAGAGRAATRALALLIPTVILVSTISTLVGAGSHLVANDLLEQVSGERVSFLQWALWGVPFGLAASVVACWVVQRLFLAGADRAETLTVAAPERSSYSSAERRTLFVVVALVLLWSTEAVHGVEIAFVAVMGAVALTAPSVGVLSWKKGVSAVSWNLVVFVGAALVLGEALIETGAAQWIIEGLFAVSGIAEADSTFLVLLILALLTLTSHVYMTSHAARAAALVPAVLFLGQSLDLDLRAVMFISTVGMDYCLTFAVSSKALLMFSELDDETFEPPDLLKLSAVMFVAHVVLIVAFYLGYWRLVGLEL